MIRLCMVDVMIGKRVRRMRQKFATSFKPELEGGNAVNYRNQGSRVDLRIDNGVRSKSIKFDTDFEIESEGRTVIFSDDSPNKK